MVFGGQQRADVALQHEVGLPGPLDGLLDAGVGGMHEVAHLPADRLLPVREGVDVRIHARDLGLAGYARNLADGRVEVVTRGDEAGLARLEQILRRGPANAHVTGVAREDAADDPQVPTRSFDIR